LGLRLVYNYDRIASQTERVQFYFWLRTLLRSCGTSLITPLPFLASQPTHQPPNPQQDEMSRAGLRTLVIAQKELSQQEYLDWNREFEVGGGWMGVVWAR